jgi:GTP-binding protein HflX
LQEAREADLLLHVIDAADPERAEHRQVNEVLASIGADDLRRSRCSTRSIAPETRPGSSSMPTVDPCASAVGAQRPGHHEPAERTRSPVGNDLLRVVLPRATGEGPRACPAASRGCRALRSGECDGSFAIEVSLRRHELERLCSEEGLELPAMDAACAGEAGSRIAVPAVVGAD